MLASDQRAPHSWGFKRHRVLKPGHYPQIFHFSSLFSSSNCTSLTRLSLSVCFFLNPPVLFAFVEMTKGGKSGAVSGAGKGKAMAEEKGRGPRIGPGSAWTLILRRPSSVARRRSTSIRQNTTSNSPLGSKLSSVPKTPSLIHLHQTAEFSCTPRSWHWGWSCRWQGSSTTSWLTIGLPPHSY